MRGGVGLNWLFRESERGGLGSTSRSVPRRRWAPTSFQSFSNTATISSKPPSELFLLGPGEEDVLAFLPSSSRRDWDLGNGGWAATDWRDRERRRWSSRWRGVVVVFGRAVGVVLRSWTMPLMSLVVGRGGVRVEGGVGVRDADGFGVGESFG